MKKPVFFEFREIFLEVFSTVTGKPAEAAARTNWVADLEEAVREKILDCARKKACEQFGITYEVNHRLLKVPGTVESAVIQAFHELNTIWLMERINEKIRARRQQLMEN